jgi:hypothetical protein
MIIAGMQTRDGGISNTVGMQGFPFDMLLAFSGMAEFLVSNHRECQTLVEKLQALVARTSLHIFV